MADEGILFSGFGCDCQNILGLEGLRVCRRPAPDCLEHGQTTYARDENILEPSVPGYGRLNSDPVPEQFRPRRQAHALGRGYASVKIKKKDGYFSMSS